MDSYVNFPEEANDGGLIMQILIFRGQKGAEPPENSFLSDFDEIYRVTSWQKMIVNPKFLSKSDHF